MPVDKSSDRVRRMFGQIAGRYDFLNHLLSLGIDRYWRWRTVRLVPPEGTLPILDVCTGTGDLALAYDRAAGGERRSSPPTSATRCWRSAGRKRRKAGADERSRSSRPTPRSLPLPSDAFQIVCVAFGLRNVADTDRGLAEMARVAAPGGRVAVLEFSTPTLAAVQGDLRLVLSPRAAADRAIVRAQFGRRLRVSAGRASASFRKAKRSPNGCARPASSDVRCYPLTFGVATLYVGRKL